MAAGALNESEILAKANEALPDDYTPTDDEEYMNERQRQFFRKLLIEWKQSLHTEAGGTLQNLADAPLREPDLTDRASSETDWGIELRTRDRQRKLISKIESVHEMWATWPSVLSNYAKHYEPGETIPDEMIAKIEAALRRIDEGEYGYCEVSGDPIGLQRLIARPVATMTVEAQEAHERREKISRND